MGSIVDRTLSCVLVHLECSRHSRRLLWSMGLRILGHDRLGCRSSLTLGHAGCLVALVTVTSVCWVAACVGVTGAAMHTMTTKQAARIHCHIQLNMDLHSAVCTEIVSCRRKSFAF